MRPAPLIGTALLAGIASALVTRALLVPDPADRTLAAPTSEGETRQRELEETVARLEASVSELRRRLDSRSDAREPVVERLDFDAELEAAVSRVLEERGLVDDGPPATIDLAAALRDLLDPDLPPGERDALWEELRESGQIDAIVAEFERRAEDSPNDTRAHTELGTAYLQKMLSTEGPEAGRFGAKGHAAFLRALEIDETNWDARFAAAQHEYWAGLGGESVQNFETLVAQQADRVTEDKHAQAYLWLGNLYMHRGDAADAIEVWKKGLSVFPGHAALEARIAEFE